MKVPFIQADVFTDRAFAGNPLAIIPDGSGLSTEQMQAIAQEMNLSETTFVLPAEDLSATIRLRIFTPVKELPLAGHPVGSWYTLRSPTPFVPISAPISSPALVARRCVFTPVEPISAWRDRNSPPVRNRACIVPGE